MVVLTYMQAVIITATQTVNKKTTVKRTTTTTTTTVKRKPGRPKGSKDTKPRKTRSDKGKKRGSYNVGE